MATAGIGGIPSITRSVLSYGPGNVQHVLYTCPANTIAYIKLDLVAIGGENPMQNPKIQTQISSTWFDVNTSIPGSTMVLPANLTGEMLAVMFPGERLVANGVGGTASSAVLGLLEVTS